jgi:SnoaL-like domain
MKSNAIKVVEEFWRLMATNDFDSVASVLSEDFVLEWPQSRERIRGAMKYTQMNREYPASGAWRFEVHKVVGNNQEAASDVTITDGVRIARAISFFSVKGALITRLTEYWPEPYAAPPGRAHLVEIMS